MGMNRTYILSFGVSLINFLGSFLSHLSLQHNSHMLCCTEHGDCSGRHCVSIMQFKRTLFSMELWVFLTEPQPLFRCQRSNPLISQIDGIVQDFPHRQDKLKASADRYVTVETSSLQKKTSDQSECLSPQSTFWQNGHL